MGTNIGPRIGIDGEAQFKQAMRAINDEMKRYAAEARAVEAAYAGQDDSLESLTRRSEIYSRQVENQERAVAQLEQILEQLRQEQGDNTEAINRWESRLRRAQAELTRYQNQLEQNNQRQREFATGLNEIEQEVDGLNAQLRALAAESRAADTAIGGADGSIEALTQQSEILERQIRTQTEAVSRLEAGLNIAQQEYGETDERTLHWRSALANANAELNRMNGQLDQNANRQREYATGLNEIEQEVDGLNAQLSALAAESRSVDAALDGTAGRYDNSRRRSEMLSNQIRIQEEAISRLEAGLNSAAQAYGETDERTLRWRSELANARTELVQLNNQLREIPTRLDRFASNMEQAGQRLSTAGNTLTMGLTAPLVAAGTAAVNYASDTEESMNKVQVAFGDAAQSVLAWSDSTLTSIGLSRGTALDMAALYGDMATSMGYSQEAAADMSKTLVNLAADLASFKNISIDEANTALKSIFTGETESLKNLGVVMTQVNLESYAMAQGIKKSYQEMTQAEHVQLRYNYVLAQTQNAQGDFARTSTGTANQLRILQESLKEAAASIGGELLPVVTPVITRISELAQSFSGLDENTQKLIVQVGIFLATLGPALKLTGGIASAVSAGVTAYRALQTAHAAATASQTALNVAMSANPIGAVATAVGGLVAALASLGVTAALTTEKQRDLNKELEETEQRRLEAINETNEEHKSVLAQVAALENLISVEEKTTAQKQSIAALVDRLNESVPELNLAYDQQADSLNMTAEAIRNMAAAQAAQSLQEDNNEAMQGHWKTIIEAKRQVAAAEENLLNVQDQLNQKTQEAEQQVIAYGTVSSDLQGIIQDLSAQEAEHQNTIETSNAAIAEAEKKIAELSKENEGYYDVVKDLIGVTDDLTAAQDDLTASQEDQQDAVDDLRDSSLSLANAADTLTKALQEQESAGSLSLDTALDLIDAGYAAALSIDTETGAITLNKDTYIKLAQAKIDEQIATLEAARAAATAAQANQDDASAALDNAQAHYKLAEAKAASEDEIKSYDAQIAALKELKGSLGSYTGAVKTASSTGSRAASKAMTQAEKNLEKYKEIRDELDHLLAMGQVTEEAYYKRLGELRDQYLTDDENIDEYRKINEEIYKYDQQLAQKAQELWENIEKTKLDVWGDATNSMIEDIQTQFDELMKLQDDMAQRLSDYGDLFTMKDDMLELGDLQGQIDVLNQYEDVLNRLQERGISDSLLGEISMMDLDSAIAYGEELLAMSDEQWATYEQLWEEKRLRSIEIATKFYEDELNTLKTEYDDKLAQALDLLKDTAYGSGWDTVDALGDAMKDNVQAVLDAADYLTNAFMSRYNSNMDINSPSGVTEEAARYTAQGFEVGFVDEMRDIRDRMTRSSSPADTANQAAAGVVNGLAGLMPTVQGGVYEIHVNIDGREAATALFDPLQGIIKQRGQGFG